MSNFSSYPPSTRMFYNRIIFVTMLNIAAVKQGLFDVLLSDTDDVWTWFRFYDQVPELSMRLGLTMVDEDSRY